MLTDEGIISAIIAREGGFVNHPFDKGGPTKYGITKFTLSAWRGHAVTKEEVAELSEGEAADIYRDMYVNRPGLHHIADDKLRALLIDIAVNHGPKRAIKMLQRVLKVGVDGVIGPDTIKALLSADPLHTYLGVCAERVRAYGRIITDNPTQAVFAAGWANRAAEFIEAA